MEKFIEHNNETKHLKEIHMMQMDLMHEWAEGKDGDKNTIFVQWADKYADRFRKILHTILDDEKATYFWDDYKSDLFKAGILERIKEELYEHE